MLTGPILNFTSDLPVVILHNYGSGAVPASGDQFVMMQIFEPRNGVTTLTNLPDKTERARFKLRGIEHAGISEGELCVRDVERVWRRQEDQHFGNAGGIGLGFLCAK